MSERRMFSKKIVESDAFQDMSHTAQLLYYNLGMEADDDGFVNSPKSIARRVGCSIDDLNELIENRFILSFASGVICIKHWKMNNYIQKDRYHETQYTEEKALLRVKENGVYTLDTDIVDTDCIQDVSKMDTEDRIGKDSIGKYSIEREKEEERENSSLSDEPVIPFTPPTSVDDLYDFLPKIPLYVDDFKFPLEELEVYYRHRRRDKWKNITDEDALAQDMYLWCLRGDDYKARSNG